ncbi:MAG: hypothetical protein ABI439_06955 [Rhodospirillales bacterium]
MARAVNALATGKKLTSRVFKVRMEVLPLVLPPKDGAVLRDRFVRALGVASSG